VATIETPNNHHGIFLPDKKYSEVLCFDFFETQIPIPNVILKKIKIKV